MTDMTTAIVIRDDQGTPTTVRLDLTPADAIVLRKLLGHCSDGLMGDAYVALGDAGVPGLLATRLMPRTLVHCPEALAELRGKAIKWTAPLKFFVPLTKAQMTLVAGRLAAGYCPAGSDAEALLRTIQKAMQT